MPAHLRLFFSQPLFVRTGSVFAINAVLFGFFVTRIPEIKSYLGLNEGALGTALFFLPLGAMAAMLMVSRLSHRFGAGAVTVWSTVAFIATMTLPFLAPSFAVLCGVLFLAGLAGGAMDVSMNAVVSTLERAHGVSIMSTCHGFFSLGGMIGALVSSLALALGIGRVAQMAGGAAVLLVVTFAFLWPALRGIRETDSRRPPAFVLPGRALLGLAVIAFCSFQSEGIIADWSAVFMEEIAEGKRYMWGLGFAGFSLTMTLGRFSGDALVQRFGSRPLLVRAFFVVMAGVALVLTAHPWVSIAGFTLAGMGYALLVPIVFSEAGRAPGISPSQGIAGVATVGYTGFLLGPVVMGGIAHATSLRAGFGYLVVLTVVGLVVALKAVPRR